MEPRIQYAQTSDGVSIAYWTFGEGTPLIQMPAGSYTMSQRAWQYPEGQRWFEGLAKQRMLIRYDNRGGGNSQREVADYSLDAHVLDLEAVVDRLDLGRFVLFGYYQSGPAAITFAARHPEQLSHLILWCTSARGTDFFGPVNYTLGELREKDWAFYTETLALSIFGWSEGEQASRYAAELRENSTPEAITATIDSLLKADASNLLSQVQAPTLVLHRRGVNSPGTDIARALAARIPDSRLAVLEGATLVPYQEDMDAVLQAVDEFLGERRVEEATEPPGAAAVRTILFTDMESSTALTQRLGDAKAQEVVRAHNTIVRDALSAHAGSETKHTGDGIMASFATASSALACAVAIQRGVEAAHTDPDSPLARSTGEGPGVRVRIGLNAGEPVAEEDDLFGTAVQLAARICDRAKPGEILASNVVRELAAGKGFLFADHGEVALRGFEDPARLYEVRWREAG